MLVDVLDPKVQSSSRKQRTPLPGIPKTFHGILDWKKKDDTILASTIYSPTEGIIRKFTTVEMAHVIDFPVCPTEGMKET